MKGPLFLPLPDKHIGWLLAVVLLCPVLPAQDETPADPIEKLQTAYDQSLGLAAAPVQKLDERYLEELGKLKKAAQQAGDLEKALAVDGEIKSYSEDKPRDYAAIPDLARLRKIYDENRAKLSEPVREKQSKVMARAIQKLESLKTAFTRAGDLQAAVRAEELRTEIAKQLEEATAKGKNPIIGAPEGDPVGRAEIPRDAVRHNRSHYMMFLVDEPLTWEEARERCQELGGDLGWLDSPEDESFIVGLMRKVNEEKGHVPVWVGASRNDDGDWEWVNGEKVEAGFWQKLSDAQSAATSNVMVRWIGGFRSSSPDASRVAGYLCRWE